MRDRQAGGLGLAPQAGPKGLAGTGSFVVGVPCLGDAAALMRWPGLEPILGGEPMLKPGH